VQVRKPFPEPSSRSRRAAAATRSSVAVSATRMCRFPAGPYSSPGATRMPPSAASSSAADQQSCAGWVTHRYRPASEWSTAQPAAANAASKTERRAAYRSRCSAACTSSDSAAAIAACTGPGMIIPACFLIASRSATSAGSPVTNPAR